MTRQWTAWGGRSGRVVGVTLLCGTAATLAVVTSPASSAATEGGVLEAKGQTYLICLNRDGSRYRRKEQPKQCAIHGKGGVFAGGVNLKKLNWRGWGSSRAKATGIECGFRLPCQKIKAKVRVWRPRERCGKRVYTRFKARTKYGSSRADVHGCPGSPFKLSDANS